MFNYVECEDRGNEQQVDAGSFAASTLMNSSIEP